MVKRSLGTLLILQIIQTKLKKLNIAWSDEQVELTLAEVDQAIKNYCHIENIPKELDFVRAGLTVDCIRHEESNVPVEGDTTLDTSATSKVGPLSYLISGAVTYGFSNSRTNKYDISNGHVVDLDATVRNYVQQLNAFRRLL